MNYLIACAEGSSHCERRCQYAADIFQVLVSMRDEVERETAAMVVFEPENLVVVSGLERNVQAALRLLDSKAQELARKQRTTGCLPSTPAGETVEKTSVGLSQDGAQAREHFRQCRHLESEDSSYDSDYENSEPLTPKATDSSFHDDVSRTVSDTLAAEYAEYVTKQQPGVDAKHEKGVRELSAILSDPNYTSRVEFALKLGYTAAQVQIALQKLGSQPSQNELLAELIKLGAACKGVHKGSDDTDVVIELGSEISRPDILDDTVNLRHVVIDGSNVAMSHGNKECFSCRGIKLCVDWFKARGHKEITVFVPRWRKEASRPDAPIKDQDILVQLEKERLLVFTPSRHVGGRRMVCYDDRYILKLAVEVDGIVVSNDNYRDLANENPEFKKVVEERLLMYSFVNDRFMPPDDPLGRHGPALDNFLRKHPMAPETLPPPCPYGKKCTYGNKCKYYHPERGNQPQKSVTERLAEQAKIQLQEVKSRGMKSKESTPSEKAKSQSLAQGNTLGSSSKKKLPLTRTKSLVPPPTTLPDELASLPCELIARTGSLERTKSAKGEGCAHEDEDSSTVARDQASLSAHMLLPSTSFHASLSGGLQSSGTSWTTTVPQITLASASPCATETVTTTASSWAAISPTLPKNITGSRAELFLEPDSGGHLFVAKRLSDPDSHAGAKSGIKSYPHLQQTSPASSQVHSSSTSVSDEGTSNLHKKLQRQLTLNPTCDPRLVQFSGYMGRGKRLLSTPQEHYGLMRHTSEKSLIGQRASSQENIHMLHRAYGALPRGSHQPLTRLGSDNRSVTASSLHVPSHLHPWEGIAGGSQGEHHAVTRIASAPDSYHQWPPPTPRMQHLNSTSDTRLNIFPEMQQPGQASFLGSYGDVQNQQTLHHWLVQSARMDSPIPITSTGMQMMGTPTSVGTTLWQEQSAPSGIPLGTSPTVSQPVRPSSVPPQGMQLGHLSSIAPPRTHSPDLQDDARYRLYYHLSSIFPEDQVRTAMEMYPEETNPQKICATILQIFPKG